jgi:hypothetical protein
LRDWSVHAPSQLVLDILEFRPCAVTAGFPLNQELALTRLGADVGEAQEIEGLRFAKTVYLAVGRRMGAELNDACLVRVRRQCERLKSCMHRIEKAPRVGLMLEAGNDIIGIPAPVCHRLDRAG